MRPSCSLNGTNKPVRILFARRLTDETGIARKLFPRNG